MAARRLHERAMQRPHVAFAKLVSLGAEFLHHLPHFLCPVVVDIGCPKVTVTG